MEESTETPIAFNWSCACGASDAVYRRESDPMLQARIDASRERFRNHPCALAAARGSVEMW